MNATHDAVFASGIPAIPKSAIGDTLVVGIGSLESQGSSIAF
jgi:hypothetical protein